MQYLLKLKIILRSRYLFKILTIITLILSIIITNYYPFKSKYNESDKYFTGIINKYKITDNNLILEIKAKEKLIIRYKIKDNNKINIKYGDKVLVEGLLKEPLSNDIPNTFNYKNYLYNNKIYYIVESSYIRKISSNKNYLYTIKNILIERINKLKSSIYIKALLLGINEIDISIKDSYRVNGISHLFSISGMHLSIISYLIYYYLDRVTYNKKLKYILVDIFLIIYYLLVRSNSLLRAVLMIIIFNINKLLKLKIKNNDLMLIVLIISFFINPFLIKDTGYIYSYIISFFLVVYSNKIKGKYKLLKLNLFIFTISLPLNIYFNYEVNLLSIIINLILVPIISIIIIPLSILTILLPILDNTLYYIINIIENISIYLSNIKILTINFYKPSIIIVIIYYLLIVLYLYNSKYIYLFILLIFLNYIYPYINPNSEIIMFDVGQGDSILIRYPYNKYNILIDTGKSTYLMKNNIIMYLKSKGIKKINYEIITHGDLDHIGGAISSIKNFKVDNVILNNDSFNNNELELIKELKKYNIKYYNNIKFLNLGNNKLQFLNTKLFDSENENSLVIYTKINNKKILLMGDSGIIREKEILKKYNIKDIDILKVGHHGSKSSSSLEFISNIKPKVCLISVGKNNIYHHPNNKVISVLEDYCQIYRTDINGSTKINIKEIK